MDGLGKQFLSRAALTVDDDGRGGGRHLFGTFHQGKHFRALGLNAGKAVFCVKAPSLDLAAHPLVPLFHILNGLEHEDKFAGGCRRP